jgi:hypothetical protein
MVVEILGGNGLHKAFKELDIDATRTYKGSEKPHYEVWELSKEDVKKLEYAYEWEDAWGWWSYSKGEHRGTAYDFITINGVGVISWQEGCKKDTFNCLTDYFKECIGVTDRNQICAYSVYLAKTNGWSVSDLWRKLEG